MKKENGNAFLRLKNNILSCNFYFNGYSILIRPLIPPTKTHRPFSDAKQRIYMSATLGEGGELERLMGTQKIQKIPAPEGWDKQGIGRRLFFFPMKSFDDKDCYKLILHMIHCSKRALILTPSEKEAELFRKIISDYLKNFTIFCATEIESSKKQFVEADNAVAIVANRYDGIDLIGDECRLLIVSGLPESTNLQERFLTMRMGASILYNDRIITRITQAVGRCTRSSTDFAGVVILGEKLNNYLLQKEKRGFFHPELQSEIEFGFEESGNTNIENLIENFNIFLKHDNTWQEADNIIVETRDNLNRQPLPCLNNFLDSVKHEIKYLNSIWDGDFTNAINECRSVLDKLNHNDLRGYRAFWHYLAGSAAWLAKNEEIARNNFGLAAKNSNGIPWFRELSRLGLVNESHPDEDPGLDAAIENLEYNIERLGTVSNSKFENHINTIRDELKSENSKLFEHSQVLLGSLLGYVADNTGIESGPDPWWILNEQDGIVFEDYSESKETTAIPTKKVRQAKSHPEWLVATYTELKNTKFTCVILSPSCAIDEQASKIAQDIFYWNLSDFVEWAENAINAIESLRNSFKTAGDLVWRMEAKTIYKDNRLTPNTIIEIATEKKLSSLPKVKL